MFNKFLLAIPLGSLVTALIAYTFVRAYDATSSTISIMLYNLASFMLITAVLSGIYVYLRSPFYTVWERCITTILNALNGITRGYHEFSAREFLRTNLQIGKPKVGYHAQNRAYRDAACTFATSLAGRLQGGPDYFPISESAIEQQGGVNGTRAYYQYQDLDLRPNFTKHPKGQLIVCTDVDYFLDLPRLLSAVATCYLFYTFSPTTAGESSEGEQAFRFLEDGSVEVSMEDGNVFNHKLWDYNHSELRAVTRTFGIPTSSAVYKVLRKRVGPHRALVFLIPTAKFGCIGSMLLNTLTGYTLVRVNPIVTRDVPEGKPNSSGVVPTQAMKFARMRIQDDEKVVISTARAGQYRSVTILAEVDEDVGNVARLSATPLTMPCVKSHINDPNICKGACAILALYHRCPTPYTPVLVFDVRSNVRAYQCTLKDYDPNLRLPMDSFMSPILDGGFVPTKCLANEDVAIAERVTKTANRTDLPAAYEKYVREWINLSFKPNEMAPITLLEVRERQHKRAQLVAIDNYEMDGDNVANTVTGFNKTEAYGNIKPPRRIGSFKTKFKVEYGQFMYPFTDALKASMHWYPFGKTPAEIEQMVVEKCDNADYVDLSDFSKFDGTISQGCRDIEEMIMLHCFKKEFHIEMLDMMHSQYNTFGYSEFSERIYHELGRISGSQETGGFNSCITCIVAYITYRYTVNKRTKALYTPDEAYAKLGCYGGDDGLSPDIDSAALVRVATSMGLRLASDVILRGAPGVQFLSRNFGPAVWFGDPNNCCDIARQVSKFHICQFYSQDYTNEHKLLAKARSFYDSDANTPIIGPLVTKAVNLGKNIVLAAELDMTQYLEKGFDTHFSNIEADWMQLYAEDSIPDFAHDRYLYAIEQCTSLTELTQIAQCAEPIEAINRLPYPVVVDDDILPAAQGDMAENKFTLVGKPPTDGPTPPPGPAAGQPPMLPDNPPLPRPGPPESIRPAGDVVIDVNPPDAPIHKVLVVIATPCTGKSYAAARLTRAGFKCFDTDTFKWRNPSNWNPGATGFTKEEQNKLRSIRGIIFTNLHSVNWIKLLPTACVTQYIVSELLLTQRVAKRYPDNLVEQAKVLAWAKESKPHLDGIKVVRSIDEIMHLLGTIELNARPMGTNTQCAARRKQRPTITTNRKGNDKASRRSNHRVIAAATNE